MNNQYLKHSRIDSILIWGHGMEYFDNILIDIASHKDFEILKIRKHRPKNIKKFVRHMYSYDYAPYWHLKSKTKYLLKTHKEVCFIFTKNLNPQEDYFGENSFRHKESVTLKGLKEELRNKYNPYENGVRTHNHVIHATDSQEQTASMLEYLGYKEGLALFNTENKFINLPYYIKGHNNFEFKTINVNDLSCNIIAGNSCYDFYSQNIPVTESPHYKSLAEDIGIYEDYVAKYIGGPLQQYYNPQVYQKLCRNFEYLKEPYQKSFVIVKKNKDAYTILDGLHRASAHIYQKHKKIKVCVISN